MQIFNKSTKKIIIDGKFLAPNETIEVANDLGNKLAKIYVDEIIVIDKSVEAEPVEAVKEEKIEVKPKAKKKA